MAKLMLIGQSAQVEITRDPIDGGVVARCVDHGVLAPKGCKWSATYDNLGNATEYASDHADHGIR